MLYITCGCTIQESLDVPEYVKDLENLTIFSESISEKQPSMDINFRHEVSFENADLGAIRSIAVDEQGRLFNLDYQMYGIHVFKPNGDYLTFIGGEGSGPGEFQGVSSMRIVSNILYVYDGRVKRMTEYNLDSLVYSEVKNIGPLSQDEIEKTTGQPYQSIGKIIPRIDGTLMVEFFPLTITTPSDPRYNLEDELYSQFYKMDFQGRILSEKLFELKNRVLIPANVDGHTRFNAAYIYDFLGKPLITKSDDDYIYTAWSNDFLVKVYAPDGKYHRAFYYPHERKKLERHEAIRDVRDSGGDDYYLGWIQNADLPETWPALNDILIDDEERLWISTIVEGFDVYEWWVLEETGELITKFEWPRNEPIEVVRNEKIYTHQTDEETGLQQILRYRIELKEL